MVWSSGAERILAFLGRGAIVGELSIIDGLPRSASVVPVRDAAVSFLSSAAFEAFAEKHPELYKPLVRLLARRLRETDTNVAATSFLSLKGFSLLGAAFALQASRPLCVLGAQMTTKGR